MAIDFDAIRKKLGQLSGNNSKRRVMWRPPQDETTTVRLIAFTDNDGNPFKERYFYYNIGNNPGLLAPYQFGKPDPINELIQKFKGEGTKEGYEMAKKLYPKMRTYAAVIVRGEEDQGVRLWAFGKTVYQNLLNIMLDPDYGDITDVSEGHDIKVTCSKQAGRQFATTDVMPRPKSTTLGTKKQVKEWTENIPDLDDIYQMKSYEQLETIVNAWLNGDDVDNDNEDVETTTTFKNAKSNKKTESKEASDSFDKIDDAFADLGGDLPF
tara:strand:- start:638 stop:1438 length:801 start_codon:yes stop_codon:yes gene_type:complete